MNAIHYYFYSFFIVTKAYVSKNIFSVHEHESHTFGIHRAANKHAFNIGQIYKNSLILLIF